MFCCLLKITPLSSSGFRHKHSKESRYLPLVSPLPPSMQLWCKQPRGLPHPHLPAKSINIQKLGKVIQKDLKLYRKCPTYPCFSSMQESRKTQKSELKQLSVHLARTALSCPSRYSGSYLHGCVKKLAHISEAPIRKLVELQPVESSLDAPIVQENVWLGLDKAFDHKWSQPGWRENRKDAWEKEKRNNKRLSKWEQGKNKSKERI